MKNKYKLTIAYDGTHYSGWQIQPNAITIQQKLQDTLAIFLKDKITIIGAGRTDAGVHALEQVAHFQFSEEINPHLFLKAANGLLLHDIRIKSLETVSPHFHAQYSATSKIYHYLLTLDHVQPPFQRLYSYHVKRQLNLSLLKQAAKQFIGTHDFTSFTNSASEGCAAQNATRTITRLDVTPTQDGLRLEFEADGFLYKMVRNITGTLLEIATHQRPLDDIPKLFTAKDRRQAGKAAPPHGLFLTKVNYSTN